MPFDAVTERALPSRVLTELHLLRHGKVDTGGERLAYGHSDLPLTAGGLADSEALQRLALHHTPRPAGVLSSDLQRCLKTARPIAEALGVPLKATSALREQHMGDWEGRPWGDIHAEDPEGIHAYWADYVRTRPPGGESMQDLRDRVMAWWAAEQATLEGRRWIVVTHIGVIRVLLCEHLGHPLNEALRFAPARGSHTHLLLAEAGAVLQVLGERAARPDPTQSARPTRIALSGSAGVGKSTLGAALARQLDLPFLPEGMRARLEAGLELHALNHEEFKDLIRELWEEHAEAEAAAMAQAGGFVSDRSAVDFAAFWLYYGFSNDQPATEAFLAKTLRHAKRYDRVLLLPWGALPLVNDGVRSPNRWLQRHFQATVEGMLHQELPPGRLLRVPPLEALQSRLDWALAALRG